MPTSHRRQITFITGGCRHPPLHKNKKICLPTKISHILAFPKRYDKSEIISEIHNHKSLFAGKANCLSGTACEHGGIPEAEAAGIGIFYKTYIAFLHAPVEVASAYILNGICKLQYAVIFPTLGRCPSCRLFLTGAWKHQMKPYLRIYLTQLKYNSGRKRIPADSSAGVKIRDILCTYPPFKNAVQTFFKFCRLRNYSVSCEAS